RRGRLVEVLREEGEDRGRDQHRHGYQEDQQPPPAQEIQNRAEIEFLGVGLVRPAFQIYFVPHSRSLPDPRTAILATGIPDPVDRCSMSIGKTAKGTTPFGTASTSGNVRVQPKRRMPSADSGEVLEQSLTPLRAEDRTLPFLRLACVAMLVAAVIPGLRLLS